VYKPRVRLNPKHAYLRKLSYFTLATIHYKYLAIFPEKVREIHAIQDSDITIC